MNGFISCLTSKVNIKERVICLEKEESVDIHEKAAHRIANNDNKQFTSIEIQQGYYFGEDNIICLEDDFGRASKTIPDVINQEISLAFYLYEL